MHGMDMGRMVRLGKQTLSLDPHGCFKIVKASRAASHDWDVLVLPNYLDGFVCL